MAKKKWLASLTETQWKWIKDTSRETGVNGSAIIGTMIDRESARRDGRFREELQESKVKAQLQRINEKRAKLDMQEQELIKPRKAARVAVTA